MLDSRVITLLQTERSDPLAIACHEFLLAHPDVSSDSSGPMPRDLVVETFTFRARMNAERGGRIIGYDRLLGSFPAMPEQVRLHSVYSWPDYFLLFTDDAMATLFGVLRIPDRDYDHVEHLDTKTPPDKSQQPTPDGAGIRNLAVIGTLCLCAVVLGVVIFVGGPEPQVGLYSKARRQWKDNAIAQIAKQTSDPAAVLKEIEAMKSTPKDSEWWDTWISKDLIVMTNGQWLAYRQVCYKEETQFPEQAQIPDIFLGRGSDGRWYYTTFHFCVNMQNLSEETKAFPSLGLPGSLNQFSNRYCLQEFDGQSDQCLKDTKHLWNRRREAILGRGGN